MSNIFQNSKKSMPKKADPLAARTEFFPESWDARRDRVTGIAPKKQIMKHV